MAVELGRREEQSPPKSEFVAKLEARWEKGNFACIGLDSDLARIPQAARENTPFAMHPDAGAILRFNREVIIATADLVCAFKPNIAFYEAQGVYGMEALQETVKFIKWNYPDIPVILDAKRADIGNTNDGYVRAAVGNLPILIPGIGAQGGEVEATVKAGRDSRGMGMIINSSREIIFASKGADFAYAARYAAQQLRDEINQHRQVK